MEILIIFPTVHIDIQAIDKTYYITGMWGSRPGLGLETDQDHFLRSWSRVSTLLVLVLIIGLPGLDLGLSGLGLGGWS